MSSERETFLVLHAIRVRGLADAEPLALATGLAADVVRTAAATLADNGLVQRKELGRRAGWILTAQGSERHDQTLSRRRADSAFAQVAEAYVEFLGVNGPFKALCTDWQLAAPVDEARAALVAEIGDVAARAGEAVAGAAELAEWFDPYPIRFQEAAARFGAGDERFLVSPKFDSLHQVWSECHEDFLVTLGRERSEADER
jgi:hypothetical protein